MHNWEVIPAGVRALIDWLLYLIDVLRQYFGLKDSIHDPVEDASEEDGE